MGFLSSLTGGSSSSGSQKSGWALLPPEIQNTFKGFSTAVGQQIPNLSQMYTPLQQTQGETNALNSLTKGFAPTAESLGQDISMFMNPYQQYVEDPVNRAAQSEFSVLKQGLNQAGQLGSNRSILGANDIENSRLSTIGGLRQGAYDSALQNVLTNLIPQRQQDATNALTAGAFSRDLDAKTKQAPVIGLQQLAQALGILPTSGGSSGSDKSSSVGGLSSFF